MMDANSTRLDVAERLAKLLREILVLAIGAYLAWYLIPLLPQFTSQLEGAKLTEVDLGGLKLKLKEAEKALEAVVRTQVPEKGNVDEQVSEQAKLAVEALDTVRAASMPVRAVPQGGQVSSVAPAASAATYWVYVGAYRDGRWVTKYFDITGALHVGDSVQATSDIFRRQSAPIYKDDNWLLGAPLGILQKGGTVKIRNVKTVAGTGERELIWAEVVPQ